MDLLHQTITEQALRRPDATAVVLGRDRLTYEDLEARSNQLSRMLRSAGCARGDRVCLLMPKTPQAIVSMLAILKAGALYVPLDPASPPARLAKILASCDTPWLLADGPVGRPLEELERDPQFGSRLAVGWLGADPVPTTVSTRFSGSDVSTQDVGPVASSGGSDQPAHILFTSGSTGTPKGVVITHANVLHFVRWAHRYFGTSPDDRISGHPPLHFDLSTFDIFGTLSAGAELHLVPSDTSLFPQKLTAFIRTSELTQWFSVPSALVYLARFDAVKPNEFPALRRLLWCGEVFPTPSLMYWMQRLPHVQFTNLYGPTEATIASSYYTLPECPADEKESIPIGRPCDGEELLVLDDQLVPSKPGETGDLYISGPGLSPGYWRDAEKTRTAFLTPPPGTTTSARIYRTGDLAKVGADGLVYYLGRADSQIKSRGYRIELGEIETAVHAVTGIKQCAVVAIPSQDFEGHTICCAYSCDTQRPLTPADLRSQVSRAVPPYMLPARWLMIEHFPQNANGKIDRPALRDRFRAEAEGAAGVR